MSSRNWQCSFEYFFLRWFGIVAAAVASKSQREQPMQRHNVPFSRKQLTTLFSMTKKRPSHSRTFTLLSFFTVVALAFIGYYTGHFSGASQVPMAATVVPLLFGLLTAVLLHDVTPNKLVAVLVFVLAFSQGHRLGQWVDEPISAHEMLEAREQINTVANEVFDELLLLDVAMTQLDLDGRRHNAILYGVGARFVENPTLTDAERIEKLKAFRAQLEEMR